MVLPLCTQYQELQASAQLQGDNVKEARMQISQLRQAMQRLQSQIASLKMQVGSPCLLLHAPAAWCLRPPLHAASFPDGLVGGCVTGWDSEIGLQVTSELTLPVPCGCQPECWLLLTVSVQVDILLLPPWREGQFNSRFISSFDFLHKQTGT